MDYSYVNHAAAYAWQQQHAHPMMQQQQQQNQTVPPFQFPTAPDQPMPTNPMFFNQPGQSMNLQNLPARDQIPQYQQLNDGEFQMGTQMHPPMQTPMAVNTGIFMQNPMHVHQFMQNHMQMQGDDQSMVPPFEVSFDASGSMVSQDETNTSSTLAGSLGDIPGPRAPDQSLFMQYMAPPGGMPQQMAAAQNQMPPWQQGGFQPMSTPQMRTQMPGTSQMQMPSMQGPQTPQMQMSSVQGPQTPQMSQMQMSPMQMSGTTLGPQQVFNFNQQTPPSQQVRFQGVPDLNSPSNPLTPKSVNSSNSNNNNNTPQRPSSTPGSHRQQQQRPPRPPIPNNGQFAPFPQIPKAVVQISEEPWQRTFPPQRPPEPLKNASDPPSATQYEGGRMKMKDHQEYRSNMVYLGKPTGEVRDRIPASLKILGSVPEFQGDPNDLEAVRAYLNTLTDWTNQYVRAAGNSIARYDNYADNLTKRLREFELERKHIADAVKEVHGDENILIPDYIRTTHNNIGKLEETVDLLNHHHKRCRNAQQDLEEFTGLSVKDKAAVDLQKEIADGRMRELESVNSTLKLRDELLEETKMELRQAKDLISVYQVQIQEMVNKDNFNNVAKIQVVQKLLDTQEAASNLEKRYKALFERAKELSREAQSLRTIMGWVKEIPDLSAEESEEMMQQNLLYRYQVLFENTKAVVTENARMKEQMRAETSILELQAEYDKLKEDKAAVEADIGDIRSTHERLEKAEGVSKQFKRAIAAWNREKETLQSTNKHYEGIISSFKEEKDKLEVRYKAAAAAFELAKKGTEVDSQAINEKLDGLQARYDELKKKHEGAREFIVKREEEVKQLKEKYLARKEEAKKSISERDSVRQHAMELKSEYDKLLEEKQQLEAKTAQLMELHKSALAQNETLTKKYFARKVELEGLKRRLEKNGPAKIYRMRIGEKDGGVGQEECAMTMAEVMHSIAQPGLRAQLVAFLKQTGDIKE